MKNEKAQNEKAQNEKAQNEKAQNEKAQNEKAQNGGRGYRGRLVAAAGTAMLVLALGSPAAAETIIQPSQLNTQIAAGEGEISQSSDQSVGDITVSGEGDALIAPSQVSTQEAISGGPLGAPEGGAADGADNPGNVSQGSDQSVGGITVG